MTPIPEGLQDLIYPDALQVITNKAAKDSSRVPYG
jgi:hypothetical protein